MLNKSSLLLSRHKKQEVEMFEFLVNSYDGLLRFDGKSANDAYKALVLRTVRPDLLACRVVVLWFSNGNFSGTVGFDTDELYKVWKESSAREFDDFCGRAIILRGTTCEF